MHDPELDDITIRLQLDRIKALEAELAATIERCAQALEPLMQEIIGEGDDYAMGVNDAVRQGQVAIRALKDN